MSWHLFHTPVPSRRAEAEKALEGAVQRIERVHGKDDEVKQLADELRQKREANNFTSLLREAMRRI